MWEKFSQLIIRIFFAVWDRLEARKADRDHADSVRHDPGAAWLRSRWERSDLTDAACPLRVLRRFGGKDERSDSAGSGTAERDSN